MEMPELYGAGHSVRQRECILIRENGFILIRSGKLLPQRTDHQISLGAVYCPLSRVRFPYSTDLCGQ